MEFLNDYLVLVVVGICLCVGYVIKHFIVTDAVNRFIPLIMAVLGVVVNVWLNGFEFTPEILLGGLASGLASTGMHQLFKQFIEKDVDEEV
jgi:Ni,Fe-hydrogenase III small subunit